MKRKQPHILPHDNKRPRTGIHALAQRFNDSIVLDKKRPAPTAPTPASKKKRPCTPHDDCISDHIWETTRPLQEKLQDTTRQLQDKERQLQDQQRENQDTTRQLQDTTRQLQDEQREHQACNHKISGLITRIHTQQAFLLEVLERIRILQAEICFLHSTGDDKGAPTDRMSPWGTAR